MENINYEDLTLIGALVIAVLALVREWVVPGSRVSRLEKQVSDFAQAMDKHTDALERVLEVNESLTKERLESAR